MIDPVSLGVICTAAGGVIGAISKSVADNASGIRKNNFDQLQVAISQVVTLQQRSDAQDRQIETLQTTVLNLTRDHVTCQVESAQFKRDIIDLQRQLTSLGQFALNPPTV